MSKEVICINDGSTDTSGEILENYAKQYDCIKVIHQENKGVSAARNVGIKLAQGEFIMFVDADDQIFLNDFESMIDLANQNKIDLIRGFILSDKDGQKEVSSNIFPQILEALNQTYAYQKPIQYEMAQSDWYFEQLVDHFLACHFMSYIYRTTLLQQHNILFDEEIGIGEDTLFIYSVFIKTTSFKLLEIGLFFYFYHLRDCSVSKSVNHVKGFNDLIRSHQILMNFAHQETIPSKKDKIKVLSLKIHERALFHFYLSMDNKSKEIIIPTLSMNNVTYLQEYQQILAEKYSIEVVGMNDLISYISRL